MRNQRKPRHQPPPPLSAIYPLRAWRRFLTSIFMIFGFIGVGYFIALIGAIATVRNSEERDLAATLERTYVRKVRGRGGWGRSDQRLLLLCNRTHPSCPDFVGVAFY